MARAEIAGTVDGHSDSRLESALAFASSRHLSRQTLARLPVAFATEFFPELGRVSEALKFKYPNGWKARSYPEKAFVSSKGFKLTFWNIEAVLAANPDTIYITEGELDACALVEAGIDASQVLSVPNGAKERSSDIPIEQRGYGYVLEAMKNGLNRVRKVVWCGDGDQPGLALQADMAKLFGTARFHFLTWPEGCNDANDVLRHEGPNYLHELVTDGILPWPQEGLYRITEFPEPPALTLWSPGIDGWSECVRLAPRTLSVATGQPGHGKTMFWCQVWFNVVKAYNLVACVASFETRPAPHLRRQIRTLLTGKLEVELSDSERAQVDAWMNEHYRFIHHPEQRPTLEWALECAETAVVRDGARILQLDPWNRFEATRTKNETESEYVARCLRALHVFANDMNCHVQVIAHPAKMDSNRRGKPPELEDISGSKHWENMVDQGFVIHRPQLHDGLERKTEAVFYHRKARFEELGYPCRLHIRYDLARRLYVPLLNEEAEL